MPDQSPASPLDDPDYRRKMSLPAFGAFADTAGYLRLDDKQASRLLAVPSCAAIKVRTRDNQGEKISGGLTSS